MVAPKVSVLVVTYNQAPFIEQALNSILEQKTSFEFEVVIGDDCSTDGTKEKITQFQKRYPEKIKPLFNEKNIGFLQNWKKSYQRCRGEYLAILEGDDFWTDPLKLQKQVDFLDKNPDYGLVYTEYNRFYQNKNKLVTSFCNKQWGLLPSGDVFHKLIYPQDLLIQFLTTLIRKDLIDKHYEFDVAVAHQWRTIDVGLWIVIAKHSKVKYFNQPMATYRVLESSISNNKDRFSRYMFHQSVFDIYNYYANKYHQPNEIKNKIRYHHLQVLLNDAFFLKKK
ncbi:MAG: glycosyltransferase, partial [Salinivirgaceae bacterium]|nr:glycosyltransferase [Salinivirgaceae bacterium]